MTQIRNDGGNRALVCYLYGSDEDNPTEARAIMRRAINNVLEAQGLTVCAGATITIFGEDGDVYFNDIGTPRTVAINLSSGVWARSLKIGNCSGDLLVGVYFYTAPTPPEPDPDEEPDEEPEPAPSITSLVCNALQEAIPDSKVGASSFVSNPEQIDFELGVE